MPVDISKELRKLTYVELTEHIAEAVAELKRKSYGEGYRNGRLDERSEGGRSFDE